MCCSNTFVGVSPCALHRYDSERWKRAYLWRDERGICMRDAQRELSKGINSKKDRYFVFSNVIRRFIKCFYTQSLQVSYGALRNRASYEQTT